MVRISGAYFKKLIECVYSVCPCYTRGND